MVWIRHPCGIVLGHVNKKHRPTPKDGVWSHSTLKSMTVVSLVCLENDKVTLHGYCERGEGLLDLIHMMCGPFKPPQGMLTASM